MFSHCTFVQIDKMDCRRVCPGVSGLCILCGRRSLCTGLNSLGRLSLLCEGIRLFAVENLNAFEHFAEVVGIA